MDLRVSGKNFSIGEAMRSHVSDRIQSAVQKYFDGGVSGHVVVDHEGGGYRCDCTLRLASGITLQSEGRAFEPYASFEQAADRLERRLRRYKRRLKDHHAAEVHAEPAKGDVFASYVLEAPEDEHEGDGEFNPVIVAEKTSTLRRLSVSDAVLDLDMTGAPVLVFRNGGSDRVNIVYRRSDGNIGWIEPAASDGAAAAK